MIVHVLNGGALKNQFPKAIEGQLIVARESMIEGSIAGSEPEELWNNRAAFFQRAYGVSTQVYLEKSVSEFKKILVLAEGTEINLWFEDDLFCQTNLWFVAHLINDNVETENVFLIRPDGDIRYGFGGMDETALEKAFTNKQLVGKIGLRIFSLLWQMYQINEPNEMMTLAEDAQSVFPFLKNAVQAHIDRLPKNGKPGRPMETLIDVTKKMGTENFGEIFRAFSEREAIYGFGDMQVKRLLKELKK